MDDLLKAYRVLGLAPGASAKAVKRAYRKLAKQWHPDRFGQDSRQREQAEEKIKQINLAYSYIQDHGDLLSLALQAQKAFRPPASPSSGPQPNPKPAAQSTTPPPSPAQTEASPKTQAIRAVSKSWFEIASTQLSRSFSRLPRMIALASLGILVTGAVVFFWPTHQSRPTRTLVRKDSTPTMAEMDRLIQGGGLGAMKQSEGSSTSVPGSQPASQTQTGASLSGQERGPVRTAVHSSSPVSAANAAGLRHDSRGNLGLGAALSPAPSSGSDTALDAELRTVTAEAQGNFEKGLAFTTGEGVALDYGQAAEFYRLAAEAGHAEAQKSLGFLYASGKGVPKDLDEAEKWFSKAGTRGNLSASLASGAASLAKQAAERKEDAQAEAVDQRARAALEAEAQRQFRLGYRYARGDGFPQDYGQAARHYRLAADLGHAQAQRSLGLLYAEGKGVPKDLQEAERWFQKAAETDGGSAPYSGALRLLSKPAP